MKRSKLIDFLIILFITLALSSFPFALFVKNVWILDICLILTQVLIFVIRTIYVKKFSKLEYKFEKIDLKNTLIFIPTLLVCFSNYFFLPFAGDVTFAFNVEAMLQIVLALTVAINEETLFRLILISNFDEEKSNVYRIGVSSLVFALCHLSVFLSTFNPGDLIVVAYTLPLGILLGLTFMLSKSIIPAIVIHFLFNSFNQVIFSMFSYSALDNKALLIYIVVNVVVSLVIASYLAIVLIIKRKQQHN